MSMAPLSVYQSGNAPVEAGAGDGAGAGTNTRCSMSMSLQALPIDFNSILQIAIEAIKVYELATLGAKLDPRTRTGP